jgi:hypothetical protein
MKSYKMTRISVRRGDGTLIQHPDTNKNAHIESFFSIVDVHLQEQYFWELKDAYAWTMRFVDFYNNKRIHGSLKMSPVDYSKLTHLHGQEQYAQAI